MLTKVEAVAEVFRRRLPIPHDATADEIRREARDVLGVAQQDNIGEDALIGHLALMMANRFKVWGSVCLHGSSSRVARSPGPSGTRR